MHAAPLHLAPTSTALAEPTLLEHLARIAERAGGADADPIPIGRAHARMGRSARVGTPEPAALPLPRWASRVFELVLRTRGRTRWPTHVLRGDAPSGDEAVALPIAAHASGRLTRELVRRGVRARMSTEARVVLERDLFDRLVRLAAPLLARDRALGHDTRAPITDGYLALFSRHPALARLWEELVTDWVQAAAELAERLVVDEHRLRFAFGVTGDVLDVRPGAEAAPLGTVRVLFEDGHGLLYRSGASRFEERWTLIARSSGSAS